MITLLNNEPVQPAAVDPKSKWIADLALDMGRCMTDGERIWHIADAYDKAYGQGRLAGLREARETGAAIRLAPELPELEREGCVRERWV